MRKKGLIPYLVTVLASSFMQMGLFLFFEQWLKYSFAEPNEFPVYSALLQAMFYVPYLLFFPIAGFLADRFGKGKVIAWSSLGYVAGSIVIGVLWTVGLPQVAIWFVLLVSSSFALGSPARYGVPSG